MSTGEAVVPTPSEEPPTKLPRKAEYRQRAHCNPLSDSYLNYPRSPNYVDWSLHFPDYFPCQISSPVRLAVNTAEYPVDYSERIPDERNGRQRGIDILDMGCGFGGLSMYLADKFPDYLIVGLEIREKPATYGAKKIEVLRATEDRCKNAAIFRTNGMKFATNYFRRSTVKKMFFCFPDPHFKRSNWRRRIVTPQLLSIYAYLLQRDGMVYIVTDVKDTFDWMVWSLDAHPFFTRVPDAEAEQDLCYRAIQTETPEAQKVNRNNQPVFAASFRCVKPPH